nr:PREDICTED: nuclear envelope integral membrane protein 1-like isoform X2 [Bemisia tabaci]
MMMVCLPKQVTISTIIGVFLPILLQLGESATAAHHLEPWKTHHSGLEQTSTPKIYCYKGKPKYLIHLWETVLMELSLSQDKYTRYDGFTPEDVIVEFEQSRSTWSFNLPSWSKSKTIQLNPFNSTCIGILTNESYDITLNVIRIDYWRVLIFFVGVILFFSAPRLCENSLFYYLSGVSFGICASFLIAVYILSRMIPKKPVMYSFLASGWAVAVYLLQMISDNLRTIALRYKVHAFIYFAFSGFVSFVICYRYGPVSDPRSKNLIKWTLQGVGLILVFLSSYFQEATLSIDLFLLAFHNFPPSWSAKMRLNVRQRFFPPKPARLLTEDEYHEQGSIETVKALDHLRAHCSSPDCNQWRTILKLKDPLRFAKFMEGSSHLADDEVLEYEIESKRLYQDDFLTDDSNASDDEE